MNEKSVGRFDHFIRNHGLSFFNKHRRPVTDRFGACTMAGVAVKTKPESLPEGFIRQEVDEASYLFMMAGVAKKGIVELGRYNGGSAFLMASANPHVPIWSIDIKPRDDERARRFLELHGLTNVQLLIGDTQHPDAEILAQIGDYDLVFVDADHSFGGCLNDLKRWWPRLAAGGHVVLHDSLHKSPVADAIIAFVDAHEDEVECIRGPYLPSGGEHSWGGAMSHLRKRRRKLLLAD